MSKRLEGGFLTARPTWSTAATPGVWAPEQHFARVYASGWPSPTALFDPYFESVSLLLHMDGSNASTTFVDSSLGNLAVTANGNAQISTAQSKFGGSSGLFDGNGDYLTLADSSIWDLSGDFTIEAWVKASATGFGPIFSTRNTGAAVNPVLYLWDTGVLAWYYNTAARITGTTNIVGGNFYHVAVCRSGDSTRLFVNGVQEGATYVNSDTYVADGVWIGSIPASNQHFNGYIDDLRVTKGVARYTSNFTPPTLPFYNTTIPTVDSSFSSVSLLLHMDGANGSTTFTDSSSNALAVTANGNAQITTTNSKYGSGCGLFDGTGDTLTISDTDLLEFGGDDYTIELWINTTQTTQYSTLISRMNGAFTNGSWTLLINNSGTGGGEVAWWVQNHSIAGPMMTTSGVSVIDGAYHHIAVVRNGSAHAIYVDGVSRATATTTYTISNVALGVTIAGDATYGRNYNGRIDDLRITKGVARYTSNFYIPRAAFPDA